MNRQNIVSYSLLKAERTRRDTGGEKNLWQRLGATYSDRLDRQASRSNFIIPIGLRATDPRRKIVFTGVILNMSASGMGVLTNDRRFFRITENEAVGTEFDLNFDFFGADTDGISGRIVHAGYGPHPSYEKFLGIEFSKITSDQRDAIHRIVLKYTLSASS